MSRRRSNLSRPTCRANVKRCVIANQTGDIRRNERAKQIKKGSKIRTDKKA